MARPILGAYWKESDQAFIYAGLCVPSMPCPILAGSDPDYITVDLSSDPRAFVQIDRRVSEWTGRCDVLVSSGNVTYTEPCTPD